MKIQLTILSLAAAVALVAGCASPSQAELKAQAKITEAQATETALKRVPNGKVVESELEKEHGKLIWSFDLATPGTKDITEVHVDALTGDVLAMETETPKQQAAEKK